MKYRVYRSRSAAFLSGYSSVFNVLGNISLAKYKESQETLSDDRDAIEGDFQQVLGYLQKAVEHEAVSSG